MNAQFIYLLMLYTGLQLILGSVTFTVEGDGSATGILTALLIAVKFLLHLAMLFGFSLMLVKATQEKT